MRTPQWIKKLAGHAGELYVQAELSKRGIPNAPLPENFSEDDIILGQKDGGKVAYIQVKSCHPDRSNSFILRSDHEKWINAPENQFVVFVWLGSPTKNESPRYWIALKRDVGKACLTHPAHGTNNWERRFFPNHEDPRLRIEPNWENNWSLFNQFIEPEALE
jgi:hypothetical protein